MKRKRYGRAHGEAIKIGDSIVTVNVKAGRARGRRVTLIVAAPDGIPVNLVDIAPATADDNTIE